MELKCGYCKTELDIKLKEDCSGYSVKYAVCPECGWIEILEYIEDSCFDVNNDDRYYLYD